MSQKKCPDGQELNKESGRCRKKCRSDQVRNSLGRCVLRYKGKSPKKSPPKKSPKKCGPGEELNRDTNRCRKSCKPGQKRGESGRCVGNRAKSPKKSPKKKSSKKSPKNSYIKKENQRSDRVYCVAPFNLKTATIKDRLKSCAWGGKMDGVSGHGEYTQPQVCMEKCFTGL